MMPLLFMIDLNFSLTAFDCYKIELSPTEMTYF